MVRRGAGITGGLDDDDDEEDDDYEEGDGDLLDIGGMGISDGGAAMVSLRFPDWTAPIWFEASAHEISFVLFP